MIIGVGTDLVELKQIDRILTESSGERFIQRVLTPEERKLAETRKSRLAEFVGGRFAAKEAVVKALGCGIGKEVGFQDIEILPDAFGRPQCRLSPAAWERLDWSFAAHLHISITHTDSMAAAYAIAESRA